MNIAIAGTGNMAWFMGKALIEKGHSCKAVWGRNLNAAASLAEALQSVAVSNIHSLTTDADVCILAVSDNAIATVAAQLGRTNVILIHTSGAMPLDILTEHTDNAAVLWPLYSILKDAQPAPRNFPCALEATTGSTKEKAQLIAAAFTDNVFSVDSTQRQWLHLSAVMSNNFINHLVAICTEICKQQQLPFDVLQPILQQTFSRLEHGNAADLQTGPARRNDLATIQKHLGLLQSQPQWQQVYQAITASIQQMYGKNSTTNND